MVHLIDLLTLSILFWASIHAQVVKRQSHPVHHIVLHTPDCPHEEWNKHPERKTHCLPGTQKCFSSILLLGHERDQLASQTSCIQMIQSSDDLLLKRQNETTTTTDSRKSTTWNSAMTPWHLRNDGITPHLAQFNITTHLGWRQVRVFVLDDGIEASHQEFQKGQVVPGYDFVNDQELSKSQLNETVYHGTHVAGTIAGKNVGLAHPVTTLVDVRVINDEGVGDIWHLTRAAGFVLDAHKRTEQPTVLNFSITGSKNPLLDSIFFELVQVGIHVVVAAGNFAGDACQASPARAAFVTTVGSTDRENGLADFTNVGICVDLYAPGVNIVSAIPKTSRYATLSGTSMSTAVVTGALVQELAILTPKQVDERDWRTWLRTRFKMTDERIIATADDAQPSGASKPDSKAPLEKHSELTSTERTLVTLASVFVAFAGASVVLISIMMIRLDK